MTGTPWHDAILADLAQTQPNPGDPPDALAFFRNCYQPNEPTTMWVVHPHHRDALIHWPCLGWTLDSLVERIGEGTPVVVQTDRDSDPDYELNSESHRGRMPFGQFVRQLKYRGNDVYMTAQNSAINRRALEPLWRDVGRLPSFLLRQPQCGFFWLGSDTLTPLHHDETNNLMIQVMGEKVVRLFPHSCRDRLEPRVGVHSRLSWVTDEMVRDRGLEDEVEEVILTPGQALFLPIGWWHCVRARGVALTLVYTNFVWKNFWGRTTGH